MDTLELLGRMRSVLSEAFGERLRGVVLYGSEARGQGGGWGISFFRSMAER